MTDTAPSSIQASRLEANQHFIAAMKLQKQRQHVQAIASFEKVLALRPDHIGALHGLGVCLLGTQRGAALPPLLSKLQKLAPTHPLTCYIKAVILLRQNQDAQAKTLLIQVLNELPNYYDAHLTLSHLYLKEFAAVKAQALLRKAQLFAQSDPSLYINLGTALLLQAKFSEARQAFTQGLKLEPQHQGLLNNLGHLLLRNKEFASGWQHYENRYSFITKLSAAPANCPRWTGESLLNKRLLILHEQGFGDMLLSAGYFQELKARGATVILECAPPLQELMRQHPHVSMLVPLGKPLPAADYHCPAMSLPGLLGEGADRVFPQAPYLRVAALASAQWQQRLATISGYRVGIAWQGRSQYPLDQIRSIPLSAFLPLARLQGVSLVSLQAGAEGKAQLPELSLHFPLTDVDQLTTHKRDFHDTAAIMQHLDLVITSDTSVAHLAGALGIPVWVVLGEVSDWRWFANTSHSYWYPSMQLWRQLPGETWRAMLARVSRALQHNLTTAALL